MPKILVADKLSDEGVKIFQEAGFQVDCKYKQPEAELVKIIGDYDALVVRSDTKVTAAVIAAANKMKVIGRAGVGIDNVDVEAATKKGIIVMNAPGGNTISTCEQAFTLLMSLARNTPAAHMSVWKDRKWEKAKFKGVEVYSKVLGIVGMGRIGKEMAKRAIAFGMEVIVADPFVTQEVADKLGVTLVSLEDLLKRADFVTIHAPLTPETKNLISAAQLAMMKPKAFLINCARGEIVDEEALYQALKEKKIAAAALDVFVNEPPVNSKLYELENIVMTPHLGASTEEAQVSVAIEIAHCIKDALAGKAIRNALNYAQLDPETYKVIEPYFKLCEKMGKFVSQLAEGGTREIKISYIGEISSYKTDVLASALVRGFFASQLENDVNYINALETAKNRGVKVEQVKIREEEEYVNTIRLKVVTDKQEMLLEGTLFANKQARFVRIDDVAMEIAPSDYMLVINNKDKPGTIGFLGTTLGSHSINIAGMSLGRRATGAMALTVLNLDSQLDEKVIKAITANPNIVSLKVIKL